MQYKLNSSLWCCLSEAGFSLDELVVKLKALFESDGFSGILELIVKLVQETLIIGSISGRINDWGCCSHPAYNLNGNYSRSIKTSLGSFNMTWRRLLCKNCGKSLVPLKLFLNIKSHQYKSNELEQLVIDAAHKDSYRRAVESVGANGFVSVSHSTAHRWVMESDCDELDFSQKTGSEAEPVQIVPDGTGFKGLPVKGAAKKGELKVLIGVDKSGNTFPMGAWADESWNDIKKKIGKTVKHFPEGSILVADGEKGIAEAFADMVDEEQRCQWHIIRDLYHTMWQDGSNAKEVKPIQQRLAALFAIELPKEDFELVSESEKDDIEERMEKANSSIGKLIAYLESQGYTKAADYLENSRRGMFAYIRRWLRLGIITPRASSMVERIMRELGRRLKKIAYNWSDKGISKMARIILKRFTSREQWDEYWKKRQRLDDNVIFGMIGTTPLSQNL